MREIEEAREILKQIGMPAKQQNDISSMTLLALANMTPHAQWRRAGRPMLRIHDIMQFCSKHYGKRYAENTREVFRRQVIHQFQHARLVDRNPDNPVRPTNSGLTCYALTCEFHAVVRAYETKDWARARDAFLNKQGKLREVYEKRRRRREVSVEISPGTELRLSPGKHNELQAQVVRRFAKEFAPGGEILYLGDTAKKMLHLNAAELERLAVPIEEHEKLPDVILFDRKREWLYLIEAVTTHGPVTRKRKFELERLLRRCPAKRIYVSAFLNFSDFRKWAKDIAWETEVWIAEHASHMIHFNGDRLLELG